MGIGEGHAAGVGREALADDSDWLLEGASQSYYSAQGLENNVFQRPR